MEATCTTETSVDFQRATRRIQEGRTSYFNIAWKGGGDKTLIVNRL
jgi:hypothetical protein